MASTDSYLASFSMSGGGDGTSIGRTAIRKGQPQIMGLKSLLT